MYQGGEVEGFPEYVSVAVVKKERSSGENSKAHRAAFALGFCSAR